MISSTSFVIAVPSLDVSCAYYRDVLEFEIREMGDDGWRLLVSGACRIMVGECPDAINPHDLGDHSYFAYLVRNDVDDYFARASAAGAEIVKPLSDEPWGMREFGVRTVDGHRIMVGQEISARSGDDVSVTRMYETMRFACVDDPFGVRVDVYCPLPTR